MVNLIVIRKCCRSTKRAELLAELSLLFDSKELHFEMTGAQVIIRLNSLLRADDIVCACVDGVRTTSSAHADGVRMAEQVNQARMSSAWPVSRQKVAKCQRNQTNFLYWSLPPWTSKR